MNQDQIASISLSEYLELKGRIAELEDLMTEVMAWMDVSVSGKEAAELCDRMQDLLLIRMMSLTAIFEPCSEGGFHAFIREIPGVHSEGETIEEASENLVDALREMVAYQLENSLQKLNAGTSEEN